jgi:hypothetical protein
VHSDAEDILRSLPTLFPAPSAHRPTQESPLRETSKLKLRKSAESVQTAQFPTTPAEMDPAPHQPPPAPNAPPTTGLSFASQSQPAGALFNFPSCSTQPQPEPAPASVPRSTRSSRPVHLYPASAGSPTAATAPTAQQQQQQDQEHKAERRRLRRQAQAQKNQQEQEAGYQDKEKQKGLMKSLLGMLGKFQVQHLAGGRVGELCALFGWRRLENSDEGE